MTFTDHQPDPAVLENTRTQDGVSLAELSRQRPQLVVFLRHSGCPFCRQALADLKEKRQAIAAAGTGLVLVHMQTDAEAAEFFAGYGLNDVPRISDPERLLYREFDLQRGSLRQVAGPATWWRGLKAVVSGQGPGRPVGDVLQMPGAFLIHQGRILRAYRHESSSDRPDYDSLATGELPQTDA